MKIACVGYRDWAIKIYNNLAKSTDNDFLMFNSKEDFTEVKLKSYKPDLVLFYGWSWIIKEEIIDKFTCIMLHPSPLPKFRGGSPLQNQIIDGNEFGAVTLFIMEKELDAGPILAQEKISLSGSLNTILKRITKVGTKLTLMILNEGLNPKDQNHSEATYCKRRNPDESEISINEIKSKNASYLYNKIRMLQDPYPNAFIRMADGSKLLILDSKVEE